MQNREYPDLKMYINGEWIESESGDYFEAHNPASLEVIARLPKGTLKDAQAAVLAARDAGAHMAAMPVWERAELLHRIADVMEERKEELARAREIPRDVGHPGARCQQASLVDPAAARNIRGDYAVEFSHQHPGRIPSAWSGDG